MNFTLHNDQNIYITIKKRILGSQTPIYPDGSKVKESSWKLHLKEREFIYEKLKPYIESGAKCLVLDIDLANRQHRGFDEMQLTRIRCRLSDCNVYSFSIGTEDDGGWDDRYEVEFGIE